jgi:hypothetical protein
MGDISSALGAILFILPVLAVGIVLLVVGLLWR